MTVPGFFASIPDEQRIIARCRWLGAVSPETARPERELNLDHSAVWPRLCQRGWIQEASPGRFYLRELGLPRSFSERHRWILPLVLLALILLAVLGTIVTR